MTEDSSAWLRSGPCMIEQPSSDTGREPAWQDEVLANSLGPTPCQLRAPLELGSGLQAAQDIHGLFTSNVPILHVNRRPVKFRAINT